MTFEIVIFGLLLTILCSVFVTLFLKAFYNKKFINAIWLKGLSSLCFVAFGAANLFLGGFSWAKIIIFIGLCFGIVGDEILALCQIYPNHDKEHFLGGGVFFVIGHVCYMGAMIFLLGGPNWIAVAVAFAVLVAISIFYEGKRKFFVGELKDSLKLYIGIVIFFASIGTATFLKAGTLGTALLAIGGILFTISDNVLFAFKLGKNSKYAQNIILHIAYYLAQFSIAWSIALI